MIHVAVIVLHVHHSVSRFHFAHAHADVVPTLEISGLTEFIENANCRLKLKNEKQTVCI